jgi:hypothetical protein
LVAPFFPFFRLLCTPRFFLEFPKLRGESSEFDFSLASINGNHENQQSSQGDEILSFSKPNLPVEMIQDFKTSGLGRNLKNNFFSTKPNLIYDYASNWKHFLAGTNQPALGGKIDSLDLTQHDKGIREIIYKISRNPITSVCYRFYNDEISSCSYTKIVETNPLLNYTNLNGANGTVLSDEISEFVTRNPNAPTSVAGELQLVSQLH